MEALAEGFTEDVIVGLSRFSYLRVMGRDDTHGVSIGSGDVREVGDQLKARYLMVGNLRKAGSLLRISVQLVDASSGVRLWAEHYDRPYSPESIFELQDELVPRVVSTVADMNGVLPRSLSEAVRSLPAEELDPYEAVLRSFDYLWQITPQAFNTARAGLETALEKSPNYAEAWAMLAFVCGQAYGQRFDREVDYLGMAESAARKALELSPSNPIAWISLAQVLFFRKDFESFQNAAKRAADLNPMDGNNIAFLAEMLVYTGDLAKGQEFAARAKELNPHHPGWYWYTDYYIAYRAGDYRKAVSCVLKANLPEHWGYPLFLAAAYGQLGESDVAARQLQALRQLRPKGASTLRDDLEQWFEPEYVDRLFEGLRKAGFKEADPEPSDPG